MRRALVVVLAVGAVALVGAAAAGSSSGSPDITMGKMLHFDVGFSPFFLLDLGAKGISKGDEIVSHDRLFDASGKLVGHDALSCIITDPTVPESECTATFTLPGGDITTQFLNSPPPTKVGAVAGGTGIYRNVRGQFKLVENPSGPTGTLTFDLIP